MNNTLFFDENISQEIERNMKKNSLSGLFYIESFHSDYSSPEAIVSYSEPIGTLRLALAKLAATKEGEVFQADYYTSHSCLIVRDDNKNYETIVAYNHEKRSKKEFDDYYHTTGQHVVVNDIDTTETSNRRYFDQRRINRHLGKKCPEDAYTFAVYDYDNNQLLENLSAQTALATSAAIDGFFVKNYKSGSVLDLAGSPRFGSATSLAQEFAMCENLPEGKANILTIKQHLAKQARRSARQSFARETSAKVTTSLFRAAARIVSKRIKMALSPLLPKILDISYPKRSRGLKLPNAARLTL